MTECIDCGRDDRPIKSRGRCVACASKEWRRNNPDRDRTNERASKRAYQRSRTSEWARRVRLEGDRRKHLSVAYLQELRDYNPRCQCCGVEMDFSTETSPRKATLDKLIPALGYRPGNVAIICAECNRRKQDSSLDDLRRIVAYVERYAPASDTTDALTAATEPAPDPSPPTDIADRARAYLDYVSTL